MALLDNTSTVLQTTRPAFLLLSPVSILLGYATATYCGADPGIALPGLVIFGALCAHISVNTFNEFSDFRSGLDDCTRRTPFSGGSGALQINPAAANGVLLLAQLTLTVTVLLGLYFVYLRGWSIIILLVTGISIIVSYTKWLNQRAFLCLIAPGLSFGILFVVGSHVVLSGFYNDIAFYVALVPFFLTNNLLLLNQYPDIEADRSVGRRHFPIAYGIARSNMLYVMQVLLTMIVITAACWFSILPSRCLAALIPMLLSFPVIYGLARHGKDIKKLMPFLGVNVFVTLITPLVLALLLIV